MQLSINLLKKILRKTDFAIAFESFLKQKCLDKSKFILLLLHINHNSTRIVIHAFVLYVKSLLRIQIVQTNITQIIIEPKNL